MIGERVAQHMMETEEPEEEDGEEMMKLARFLFDGVKSGSIKSAESLASMLASCGMEG